MENLYKWMMRVQRMLYPSSCLLCLGPGRSGLDLCGVCAAVLPRMRYACAHCALPLSEPGIELCGACQRSASAPDRTLAVFHYAPPVDRLIHRFKFRGELVYGRLLGELLAAAVAEAGLERPELLVPVPLHPARLRQRGYNQSLILARYAGRRLALPVSRRGVERQRHTPPQMGLPARQRRKNLHGAFTVAAPLGVQRIAIVDDVMTTGATVSELARTLRLAGVRQVQVWCCARAG
jgi:ComF family protein